MNSAFLQLASYALNAVWIVALFWAGGWILSRCFKQAGLEWEHELWVATLILATIAPAAPIFRAYFGDRAMAVEVNTPSFAATVAESAGRTANGNFDIVLAPGIVYVVAGLYLLAFVYFCIRLAWMIRYTISLVRNARPASVELERAALWRRSQAAFSVPQASLLRSATVRGPVAAGFGSPVLLLPGTFLEDHSEDEFLAAVGHECAHIQRNDFRKNIFYEVVSLFTAFHPLTWLIKSQIAQTREMICDSMAAERLLSRRTYASSLIQMATKMSATPKLSSALGMFDTDVLEKRIMTLETSHSRSAGLRRHFSRVLAILVLLVCAAASWPLAQSVAAQTSEFMQTLNQQLGKQELMCTYYDKGGPSLGTCWLDENELKLYRCYLNENPELSNSQSACEWKVQRALNAKK